MKKAQSSLLMIVFVIMIFAGLGLFLLSIGQTVEQSDYMNIYTHNLLLTLLRSDTGENSRECKYVSDAIACAVTSATCFCEEGLASRTINSYMESMETLKPTYDWHISVTDSNDNEKLSYGNSNLPRTRTKKWSATESIIEIVGVRESIYTVTLILAQKS